MAELSPHDQLTALKLLDRGRSVLLVAAAVQKSASAVQALAERHAGRYAEAAAEMQAQIDQARQPAAQHAPVAAPRPPAPMPAPRADDDSIRVIRTSVDRIQAHPSNIGRDLGDLRDLAASIKARGVLVPVAVERSGGTTYRLRDGHRRIAAARLAGVKTVTAILHPTQLAEKEWLLESVEYNVRRAGYTDDDKRRVARRLLELGVSRAAIGQVFDASAGAVKLLLAPAEPSPAAPTPKPATVPRPATTVSRKALREFLTYCEEQGYNTDVQAMLAALLDGRPWREATG